MPVSRARKKELVASYVDILNECDGMVFVHTSGLSVSQIQGLRAAVREQNGRYLVAKNSLMRHALEQANWIVPRDLLEGPVAIIFGRDNMPGVAKSRSQTHGGERLRRQDAPYGGIMSGDVLNPDQVDAVSKLPTLDELRARIAGLMMSPAQGIVSALHQATGGVVNVLQAYLDKQEDGGSE